MSTLDDSLQARLRQVNERIGTAARAVSRDPASIRLVAVSKTFPASAVVAAARAGQRHFGENYVQEAIDKIARVRELAPDLAVHWHFIGPIQSNKTRVLAAAFDWVESVDRIKVAERLSAQRPAERPALNVLLQVNISDEASKAGVAPAGVLALAQAVKGLPRLRLRGLMAIPQPQTDPPRQREPLSRMRQLFDHVRAELRADDNGFDTLSMGMTDDLEAAIVEGATEVRIGTAVFGPRG
jgi:pyridoxal phosphate enzyme (YggS family)